MHRDRSTTAPQEVFICLGGALLALLAASGCVSRDCTCEDAHDLSSSASSNGSGSGSGGAGSGSGGATGSGGDGTTGLTGPIVELTSDDFDSEELDSVWTLIDPLGDASVALNGAGTGQAVLELSVPRGTAHDPWQVNQAARLVQVIGDEDFSVEAKFESEVTEKYQIQGLVAERDDQNFIRLDLYSDGSSVKVFAAVAVDGSMTTHLDATVSADTRYLRLAREGATWTAGYSADGVEWLESDVDGELPIRAVGLLVGNAGDGPAHTARVDYFFDTQDPIEPEDPVTCEGDPPFDIELDIVGEGSVSLSPEGPYDCNQTVELTAEPDAGNYFVGWGGDAAGSEATLEVNVMDDLTISAEFAPPSIVVWYGDRQSFGALGEPQPDVNILGSVVGGTVQSLTYALNGSDPVPTSTTTDNLRIVRDGNFVATIPFALLESGENTVDLVAVMSDGAELETQVIVDYSPGNVWPLPYTADFADPDLAAFSEVAQVVDGWWGLEALGARTLQTGYDRLIAVGDASWTEYEVLAEVLVHDVVETSNPSGVGIAARWPGHNGLSSPPTIWYPLGCIGMYRFRDTLVNEIFEPDGQINVRTNAPEFERDEPHLMKLRIESRPDDEVWCGFSVWPKDEDEPATWSVEAVTDSDGRAPPGGSVLLVAHNLDLTFANVSVTPLE